jgi:hypothetical protein
MLISAVLLTIIVPMSVTQGGIVESISKPYIVQAVIDSARLIGLPPSRAARAYATKIQTPDPTTQQIMYTSEPLAPRSLFFKSYFQQRT